MQAIVDSIASLIATLLGFADFVIDLMLWLPRVIIEEITDWFITVVTWINSQVNIGQLESLLGSIPASVWYFASAAQIGFGIKAVLVAYSVRFVIRRIPGIG